MAKQNFLAGGYIGKLGNTVGQRWKDKKIVRTYVKPHNPNTPAQQTAREQFATANKLAQQAMVINGHQGIWDTSTKPEYAQRVGQAMRRLRLGYPEQDCIPLYPEGQAPSLAVSIKNVTFDAPQQKYTIHVSGFGINTPAAAEISFYSPLFYLQDKYTENIIHGTVDNQAGLIEIDLSAQNTQDNGTVKTNFQQAMQLGFVALKAKFFDVLGTNLTNISIQRRFSVPSVIYDFDETTTMQTTTDKVVFTQAITANRLAGSITVDAGLTVPTIFKTSANLKFYAGVQEETVSSQFVTIAQAQQTPFTIAVTPNSANLQESTATSYFAVIGATRPYIIKDTSSETYTQPVVVPVLQSAQITPDHIVFTFDQDLTALGVERTNVVGYKFNPVGATPLIPTAYQVVGQDTTQGNTVRVLKPYAGNIAEPFIGKLSFEFKAQGGAAMPALNCEVTSVISDYFVPANNSATQNDNTTVGNYSGKTIGGNWSASIANPQAFGNDIYHQLYAKLTYIDGTSETKNITGFVKFATAAAEAKTISGFTAGKEIRNTEFFDLSVSVTGGLNQPNLSKNTINIQTTMTIDTLAWDYDWQELSFTLPQDFPPFLKKWQVKAYSMEAGVGIVNSDPEDITLQATDTVQTYTFQTAAGEGFSANYPIWLEQSFLYEDGTKCTSMAIRTYSPATNKRLPIGDAHNTTTALIQAATVDASAGTSVTMNITSGTNIPAGNSIYCKTMEISATNGTLIAELDGEGTVLGNSSVRINTTGNYETGANYTVNTASFPGFWTGVQENLAVFYTE